jgi:hypothetical protein
MSIKLINRENYKQKLTINIENKNKYGEIFTPFKLIDDMFNMMPIEYFKDKTKKWLDAGAGSGYFSMVLYWKLYDNLKDKINNDDKRHNHIINNMIFLSEINKENINNLYKLFGNKANIIEGDYLLHNDYYDYIIGNPPYNSNGLKKVPTNNKLNKKNDGKTIWTLFIRHSIYLLRENGNLLVIIPSIWMKPDKANMYPLLTSYKIKKLKCLTNTETKKIFNGYAQTPTCYFLLEKKMTDNIISLYDKDLKQYFNYNYSINKPIPVYGISVINKIVKYLSKNNIMNVIKTNLPSKKVTITDTIDKTHQYINIKTCILNGNHPKLVLNYSDKPLAFYDKKKIVLPHKMYGFPFLDLEGKYGISNRDNYVILSENDNELIRIQKFLSTKTALYLFECTRYRMKYLDKYIFELIPDINKLIDFPNIINDETIFNYFQLDNEERNAINKLHKKDYSFKYNI